MKIILLFFLFTYNLSQGMNNSLIKKSYNETYNENINLTIFNINHKKKNLIFSIIEKYSLKEILPFFESLIKANFENCDVVMFVRKVSLTLINYLKCNIDLRAKFPTTGILLNLFL